MNLNIKPGELIAIIGGSGAGKSTILNCMCGYLQPTQGEVFINGVNLYQNFDSLKKLVGYVPQSDIVYGERIVIERERKRLKGTPYELAVNSNASEDLTAGFDVLSFTAEGVPIYIEVKTTVLGKYIVILSRFENISPEEFLNRYLSAEV